MTSLLEVLKHLKTISPPELDLDGKEGHIEIGPDTRREQENTTINRILVTVYPSAKATTKASQEKMNLLLTYYPMFSSPRTRIVGLDLIRLRLLTKNYISSYVMGSSWASANDGLTDALAEVLQLEVIGRIHHLSTTGPIPLGRVCKTGHDMNHSGFINYLTKKLGISSVTFTGSLDDEVERVLLCIGDLVDEQMMHKALQEGIRTIVTGHLTAENRMIAHTTQMNAIELGQFITEAPGMKRLKNLLSIEYPEMKIEYVDNEPITQMIRSYQADMA